MIIEATIISFAAWLGNKIVDKGFDIIYDKLNENKEIDDKFEECIGRVAKKLEIKYPNLLGNSIEYFFTQEEVFNELCKLLFVNQKVNLDIIAQSFDETTLPHNFIFEFITELRNQVANEPIFQDIITNKEIYLTVKGISKNIDDICLNSTLSHNEIKTIRELLQKQFREKFDIQSFLSLYRNNLINNIKVVNFIGLGIEPSIKKGKRKELELIFVKPFFRLLSKHHIDYENKNNSKYKEEFTHHENGISFSHLFDRPYNYVILGNPGAGKSLLIKSIILYISKASKQFKNQEILTYIPFRIELKNYLAFKKSTGGNILKYLSYLLEDEYSISGILEENLEFVFKIENIIMFFDGLDEIFNVNDKIQVKNDIENFHNKFSKIRSITTSRFIGYNEAKLDDRNFCELNILSFNQEQIIDYVTKWYSLEETNAEIRNTEISDFISKMNNVDNELLSNPLLLSLIVILYRNNLKIPDSKLEIYQSCTNTLVDKWDANKNLDIEIDNNILLKKEPIFSDLAFWQYETLSSDNTEVTYYKAKKIVAESLIKKKIADEHNCEQYAEIFLNYAQKRSIYFDNNFTHKTFLEYYTAYWIYSNIEKKHDIRKRDELLKKYISNPFWFIVLELLLNLIDKDQPDNDILDDIITGYIDVYEAYPFLIYILPNLKNLSEEVQQLVYVHAINLLISTKNSSVKPSDERNDLFSRIQTNFAIASQQKLICRAIDSIDVSSWNKNFYGFINELDFIPNYREKELDFVVKKTDEYQKAVNEDPYLYQINSYKEAYEYGEYDYLNETIKYIDLFGIEEIFKRHKSFFDSFFLGSYLYIYFFNQLKDKNISSISNNLEILEKKKLTKIELLQFILNNHHIVFPNNKAAQFLIDNIDNVSDEIEKTIYIGLLKHSFYGTHFRRTNLKIENLTIPEKIDKILKKTKGTNDPKKVLQIIISDMNITDKRVLNLQKTIKIREM